MQPSPVQPSRVPPATAHLARHVRGRTVWVKICGTTSEADALLAVAMGADAIGFVFAPSPRQVSPSVVSDIVKRLPPEVVTVGVFRDEAPDRVVAVTAASGLQAAQLHGRETPDQTQWVRARLPMVIKAFSAGNPLVRQAHDYGADAILLDGASPGSGQVFDWALSAEVPSSERVVIAGGLDASNVGASIAQARPWGVDVASGVESRAGHKDPVKLRAFVLAARAAGNGGALLAAETEHGTEPYDWQEDL